MRYSTDSGLQGASSVHEDGKPQQMCMQGLQCATHYYAMADLLEDGVRVAQSEKADFTTLACGSMTLTYDYYRRTSCAAHTVVYNYTSTYAATSCILHVAGPNGFTANYQGAIDSNAGTVTFTASDWEGGDGYTFNATLYDLYGEELTSATTSITSGTLNTIALNPTAVTETTVTLEISKCNDCGFYVGWVDYWLSTQDPDTDPSIAHEYFNSTDTSVTITNLSSDTTYYFRATFVCDDEQTEVTGAAVSVKTIHDYSNDYFYLENTYNGTNTFTLTKTGTPATNDLSYSFDKNNWTAFDFNLSTETVNVPQGGRIYIRSSTGLSTTGNNYVNFSMSNQHTAGGHIASLLDYTQMGGYSSIPGYAFNRLFNDDAYLTDASDIDFAGVTSVAYDGCYYMFNGCTSLTTAPDLSGITSVGDSGFRDMFKGCSNLTTAPDLSGITSTGTHSFYEMFYWCSSLVTAPNLSGLTSIGSDVCCYMFYRCTSLTTVPDLSNVTSIGSGGCNNMFWGCTSLTTPPDLRRVTSIEGGGCSYMFYGCSNLTTSPDLSNVTSIGGGGCSSMLSSCISLTTAPYLGNVTSVGSKGCYYMFRGSGALTDVYAPSIKSWNTEDFYYWLHGQTGTGVVHKPANLTIPLNSLSGVPSGWTTQNY